MLKDVYKRLSTYSSSELLNALSWMFPIMFMHVSITVRRTNPSCKIVLL